MRARLLLLVALTACSQGAGSCEGFEPKAILEVAGARFTLEIADSFDEKQQGLMGRTELAPDAGMVFRWDDVAERSFWMKDTRIPLDLIAIEGGEVVSVATMEPCTADPCPSTRTGPASQVVEIAGGRAAELGIEPGDPATLADTACA